MKRIVILAAACLCSCAAQPRSEIADHPPAPPAQLCIYCGAPAGMLGMSNWQGCVCSKHVALAMEQHR